MIAAAAGPICYKIMSLIFPAATANAASGCVPGESWSGLQGVVVSVGDMAAQLMNLPL